MPLKKFRMNITPASPNSFSSAIALLKQNALPTEDITAGTRLFVAEEEDLVVGTIAVEYDYKHALLRSLSVSEEKRKSGIGATLVGFIENYVKQQGVEAIYILTTTAESFFSRRGYHVIRREDVPSFLQRTSEFSSVCPSSSIIMSKQL